jgi:hypothetical protein
VEARPEREVTVVQIVGYNTWELDAPVEMLIEQALNFTKDVEARGIARLREAYISGDEKRLWCMWDTEDLDGLQEACNQMNEQSGLQSVLTPVESFYP